MTVEKLLDTYCEAWSLPDPAARRERLSQSFAVEGRYVDPKTDVAGRDAFAASIDVFQSQIPGARIERYSAVSQHHDKAFFRWRCIGPKGNVLVQGIDVVTQNAEGQLSEIVGFFEPLPTSD